MRDRTAANNVALRTLKVVYPHLLDVACFSHTIDHVGEHFHTPQLSEYVSLWLSLFSHSPKTRLLWKEQTGKSMASFSATRWWSKWEVIHQILLQYGDVELFLTGNDDIGPSTRNKLLSFFADANKQARLQIELETVVDWGEPFVKATHFLEGNGPLALECYERVQVILGTIQAKHAPNVVAVARRLAAGVSSVEQTWTNYAFKCVEPG